MYLSHISVLFQGTAVMPSIIYCNDFAIASYLQFLTAHRANEQKTFQTWSMLSTSKKGEMIVVRAFPIYSGTFCVHAIGWPFAFSYPMCPIKPLLLVFIIKCLPSLEMFHWCSWQEMEYFLKPLILCTHSLTCSDCMLVNIPMLNGDQKMKINIFCFITCFFHRFFHDILFDINEITVLVHHFPCDNGIIMISMVFYSYFKTIVCTTCHLLDFCFMYMQLSLN